MEQQLLSLLKDTKLNRPSNPRDLDYYSLYQLATTHRVSILIYNQIYNFPDFPENLKIQWEVEIMQASILQTMKTNRFLNLYKKFLENNLKVIVVKGLICRSLYTHPDHRTSSDEDIYIEKHQFEKAKEILLNEGLVIVSDSEDVTTFMDASCKLYIEMHTSLFSEKSEAYGYFQKHFNQVFDQCIIHNIMGVEVYSLSYDLHLLFLILHFVKHFLHSGVGIRQILDIIIYSEHFGDKINWTQLYQKLDDLHLLTLVCNIWALSYDKLDFDFSKIILPENYYQNDYDYQNLLNDIIEAGILGNSSMERTHSSTITLNASISGKTSIMKSVFLL